MRRMVYKEKAKETGVFGGGKSEDRQACCVGEIAGDWLKKWFIGWTGIIAFCGGGVNKK